MFPTKIALPNRYRDKNYLLLVATYSNPIGLRHAQYKLVLENDLPYRTGVENGKFFIDPSGGPFIRQGYTLGYLEVINVTIIKGDVYLDVRYTKEVI